MVNLPVGGGLSLWVMVELINKLLDIGSLHSWAEIDQQEWPPPRLSGQLIRMTEIR